MRVSLHVPLAVRLAAPLLVVPLLGALASLVCVGCSGGAPLGLPWIDDGASDTPARDDARPNRARAEHGARTHRFDIEPGAPALRLLNAVELRNTVRDLLGVEASSALDFADRTTGFDTGAGVTVDENLFSILLTEAERLADAYVSGPARAQFPCFDPANLTEACVTEIVDTLGARAHRRPLDDDTRAALLATWRREVDEDDPVPLGACDPATQPEGHFGMREGRCRGSCGVLGGTNCPATSDTCEEGTGAVGVAYDCGVCCGPGGAFVDEPRRNALRTVVTTLLMSPRFLYRTEAGRAAPGASDTLDMFDRASLVSYTLTASMPDDALLSDARAGLLDEPRIRAHVRRLLDTEAGRARMADLIQQWVRASPLDDMVKNPSAFPKLSGEAQARALRDELRQFSRSVMFDGTGSLFELLTGTHTFVNQHTAPLYGLSAEGDALARVQLDARERAGLLTLASVMAVHATPSDPERDRPVKRGLLVFNKLLCGEVGPPSGLDTAQAGEAVESTVEDFDALTTREQFEAMMQQDDSCIGCHQQFMPHGYAFGAYDGLGRHRIKQRGRPIDTSVTDVELDGDFVSYDDAIELAHGLASSWMVASCFARNVVAYTTGSARGPAVESFAAALTDVFIDSGLDIPRLIEEVLATPALYQRKQTQEQP